MVPERCIHLMEKNSELERKVYVLENNLQTSIEQGNNLEKKFQLSVRQTLLS